MEWKQKTLREALGHAKDRNLCKEDSGYPDCPTCETVTDHFVFTDGTRIAVTQCRETGPLSDVTPDTETIA